MQKEDPSDPTSTAQNEIARRVTAMTANIPQELRDRAQWVCWKYQQRGKGTTKVPIRADNNRAANTTDPTTWSTFVEAVRAFENDEGMAGIGYVFAADDPYAGIDLDDCIDEQGHIGQEANEILRALGSYGEISPSGRGVKVFVRAAVRDGTRHVLDGVPGMKQMEIYDRGRYFAVTGERHPNCPTEIADGQAALDELQSKHAPRPTKPRLRSRVGATQTSVIMEERVRRCRAYLSRCPDAVSGQGGHDTTLRAACECYRFGLGDVESREMMRWFNENKTAGEAWTDREIEHKLESARQKVEQSGEMGSRLGEVSTEASLPVSNLQVGGVETPSLEERSKLCTDLGNAARLVRRFGEDIRYCHSTRSWYHWDGKRWSLDDMGRLDSYCQQCALSIEAEAATTSGETAEALRKWCKKSQNRDRLSAMKVLVETHLPIRPIDFDRARDRLNCQNGVVDLRTGELLVHSRSDFMTKIISVAYQPDATCPRFNTFVKEMFEENQSLISYMQRFLGYALTGDISEQIILICHGVGGNGKNVLFDTISSIMDGYAGKAPPSLLVVRNHVDHPTEIADLQGKRLVIASETEKGDELRLSLIKSLTGDATLKARRMYQDYFEFPRTNKLVLVTNNIPILREKSQAVQRRLRFVPFNMVIPEYEQDTRLMDELTAEREGILAWLVRGAVEWYASGLGMCDSISQATRQYMGLAGGVEDFVSQRCEFQPSAWSPTKTLLAALDEWTRSLEGQRITDKQLAQALRRRGCEQTKSGSTRGWRGVSLKADL